MRAATGGGSGGPAAFPAPSGEMVSVADTMVEGEPDHPLSAIMHEIMRDVAADGVIISQHRRPPHSAPVILFAEGAYASILRHMDAAPIGTEPTGTDKGYAAVDHDGRWTTSLTEPGATILTTSIPVSDGAITIRTMFAKLGEATQHRARHLVDRLMPLLKPFASAWWQLHRAQKQADALTNAIDHADIGMILVDAQGDVTFANTAARALMAAGDGVRMRGTTVGGAALADTLRLQAAVEHVISAGASPTTAPVIGLPRAARRPLMAAVVASGAATADAKAGGAIIYLVDPEGETSAVIEPACKLYGLSPVETRLTCLLAEGMSLSDAATAMRVREMTARSYLKQIFLKTETNRQAELVWLMLKSVVRTRGAWSPAA